MLIAGVVATGGCAGRAVVTSFAELQPRLESGQTIYVTSHDGIVQKGRFEGMDGPTARLRASSGIVNVSEADTATIARPEPIWQGAVVGAGVGALTGWQLSKVEFPFSDCIPVAADSCDSSSDTLAPVLAGAGLGALVGAAVDALVFRRTTVFRSARMGQARLIVFPVLAPGSVGGRITARF